MQDLARENWDHFQALVSGMLPGNRDEVLAYLKQSGSQKDWLTKAKGVGISDVSAFLPELRVPVLMLLARDFKGASVVDGVPKLAALVRGARLVLTEGSSAVIDATQGIQA